MSQNHDDAWLLALGAVVSDGGTVDWDGVERQATRSDQQRLIQQLRRLSAVVDAHRRVGDAPGEDDVEIPAERATPAAAPVTHWRHLVLLDRIGEGAFGSVYRGWDPLLERDVAVKLFGRNSTSASPLDEARHLAKVRHPNVVVVHGADEEGGRAGIWMEYIEGLTLAAIVRERGPMSPREVAGIGLDLCGALSAIHAAGLVHRDIKAQNVMRAVGGRIVLMDLSGAHAVLGGARDRFSGTPVYMAPELLHGAAPTAATDVYSLGVLLFLLLCGRLPVEADTLEGVRQAHASGARRRLRDLRADLPDALVHLVERATAPAPQDRFRSAGELEHALVHASGSTTGAGAAPGGVTAARMRVRDVALVFGLVLLALGATLAYGRWWRPPPHGAPLVTRFSIGPPYNVGSWPRISPDGRLVVFGAFVEGQQRFWARPLDTPTGYALPHATARESPFWSPDSTALAFFEDAQLKRMPLDGGEPQVLADAPRPQGGDWRGDTILYARADGIYRVPAAGGPAQQVTVVARAKGEYQHGWPQFLPDGRRFLYLVRSTHQEASGIYVGSLQDDAPWRLMPAFSRAIYTNGYLLYVREGALLAHPFDPRRAALLGSPITLAARVEHHAGGDAAFDISTTGVLIYSTSPSQPSTRLVLYDWRGRELEALTDVGWFGRPRFSPDGHRIVAEKVEPNANGADLWVYGLDPRSAMRLTRHPAPDVSPVWSPDGRTIAFSSRRGSVYDVFSKTVDAVHDEQLLFSLPGDKLVEHWSPDGRYLVGTLRRSGLWLVPLDSSDPPVRIRANETAQSWQAEFSPNGRWLAYMSTESGKPEVYVEPFPVTGARWQVSTHGGAEPHWRSGGRELLYLDAEGMLTSVSVPDGDWNPSAPQPLFRLAVPDLAGANDYAVSPDGRLLVVNTFVSDPLVPPVDVVVNWPLLLERSH